MSFDIFYTQRRQATEPGEVKNPFTGAPMTVQVPVGLSDDEVGALRAVLAQANAPDLDEFGCYVVEVADGGGADVYGDDLEKGCMVAVRELTPDIAQFLLDFLNAADWVMRPAMEGNPVITTSHVPVEGPADDSPRVVCTSAKELMVVLSEGVEAWQKYRDRVVAKGREAE
jgi:hypothetical protein